MMFSLETLSNYVVSSKIVRLEGAKRERPRIYYNVKILNPQTETTNNDIFVQTDIIKEIEIINGTNTIKSTEKSISKIPIL